MNKELEEGYAAWAEVNRRDAELFPPAQAEAVPVDVTSVKYFKGVLTRRGTCQLK